MNFSIGCRIAELREEETGIPFPVVTLYPATGPERAERFGPYEIAVARDAEPAAASGPAVLISHGSGGSHLVYRHLARALARAGCTVVMPEHPRNNRNDNSLGNTDEILERRPRLLRQVADWCGAKSYAVVGHSLGGYTALALAGGRPSNNGQALRVEHDARVRALVLLAPAVPWFQGPGALDGVRVPVQMWTAEKDVLTPAWQGEIVRRGLPSEARLEHRIVENAGHYAFLTPFPAAMAKPGFSPAEDPPGFDREAFQETLAAEVTAFVLREFAG